MKKIKSELILGILACLLIGIFIFFMLRARDNIEQYTTSSTEDIYFYIDDELVEYKGKITLNRFNNVTELRGGEVDLDNINEPIYYKNKDKVIFPNQMSIIRPTIGMKQNRINYFTTVEKTENYIKLNNVNLDMNVSNAFIYDGVNTYFFIDDVTIKLKDEQIELPSLSYVKCGYKDVLYVYNYETKEMKFYDNINYIVTAENKFYTINLSTDNLSVGEDSIVLVKNIDKLKNIK